MPTDLERRRFLALMLAAAAPTALLAQEAENPLILRPQIEGVDPRYSDYALVGPRLTPSAPFSISSGISDVAIFHPRDVKESRVVVFSHAALASPMTYVNLIWQWVSHGFTVLAPQHDDAVIENGPTIRKNTVGEVSKWPVDALLQDATAWKRRADACNACLEMGDLVEGATGVKLNLERPVIAGHGFGAYIAQLLVGATVEQAGAGRVSFRNPRFFSSISLSPQGPGVMGLKEDSWKEVASPCLYLLAEDDYDFTGQPYTEKGKAYKLAHPGYKHLGVLMGGTSTSFSGQMEKTSSREARIFEAIKAMSTAFLKAYADYDTQAFQDMKSHFFERMTLGTVKEFIR